MSSISGHKTQGKTLDKLIVGSWGRYKYGSEGWLYTILSRVADLNDLYILEALPLNIKRFKPRKTVLLENRRIHQLATTTMTSIEKLMQYS